MESENLSNNILLPLSVLPKALYPTQEDLREALREVGLEGREKSKVYQLSGHERIHRHLKAHTHIKGGVSCSQETPPLLFMLSEALSRGAQAPE